MEKQICNMTPAELEAARDEANRQLDMLEAQSRNSAFDHKRSRQFQYWLNRLWDAKSALGES